MDGELPRDELRFLLRSRDAEGEVSQRWSRYQIARAVLKRQYVPLTADDGFAAAVMLRLETPAVPTRGARVLRWAGGGAIAAAVAVVAFVATRPAGENGALPTATPALVAASAASAQQPPAQRLPIMAPQQAMPASFSDIAQPASFESFVPSYGAMARNPAAVDTVTGLPYVLVIDRPKPQASAPDGQDLQKQ